MRYYSFKKIYLKIVILFFLFIALHYFGWLNTVEDKLRNFFLWAVHPINKQSFQNNSNSDALVNAIAQTDLLSAKNKTLEKENSDLRAELNFKAKNKFNLLGAEVIAKNIEAIDQVVILNRGAKDGVKIDQPIIYGDGILIGKIIKAEDSISFARLLNDNQSKIAATVTNSDHSLGVVEGGYGLSIKMNFIPRNENVAIGDQIITSGIELSIPTGLVIGKVAAIENESYQPFQQAVITPAVEYQKVNFISIITN
ncbi:MAG: rod shape-determining protein MreC [Candidatus Magasanikbacteria bacterium]|nr:rod shape-determining protein MreC [Candidatus Magasanikbacteria bacterium]